MKMVSMICAQPAWNVWEGMETGWCGVGGALVETDDKQTRWVKALTLNTDASKRSFPEERASFGLSRFRVWNKPVGDRKSGMPAWTEMPAPVGLKQR